MMVLSKLPNGRQELLLYNELFTFLQSNSRPWSDFSFLSHTAPLRLSMKNMWLERWSTGHPGNYEQFNYSALSFRLLESTQPYWEPPTRSHDIVRNCGTELPCLFMKSMELERLSTGHPSNYEQFNCSALSFCLLESTQPYWEPPARSWTTTNSMCVILIITA